MSSHYFDRLAWWQQLATLFAQKPEQKHNESMPPGYISVEEAARRLGKSEQAVRNLCQRGRIMAERISDVWLIDEAALATFVPRKPGRPHNKK